MLKNNTLFTSLETTTLYHRLLVRFGYLFIPERSLGVIYKRGKFNRIVEEGAHRLWAWDEQFAGPIPISVYPHVVNGVLQSKEGHLFQLKLNLLYLFDLRKTAQGYQSILAEVVLKPKGVEKLKGLVDRKVKDWLSNNAGTHPTANLLNSKAIPELTRQLRHHLIPALTPFGIDFTQSDSIIFESITAPTALIENTQAVYMWQQLPKELQQAYLNQSNYPPVYLERLIEASQHSPIPVPIFNGNGHPTNSSIHRPTYSQS